MANPGHLGEPDMTIQPTNQKRRRRAMIGCTNDPRGGLAGAVTDGEGWLGQADAFDLARKQPHGGRVGSVEGELDTRRAAVDRQNEPGRLLGRRATGRCASTGTASASHALLISSAVRAAANSLRFAALTLG